MGMYNTYTKHLVLCWPSKINLYYFLIISLVNKKWEDLIGKKSEEVIGRKDLEIFEEIYANIAIEVDSIVMNEMTSIEQEEKLIIANDTKYFLSSKFPIKDKDDKISGICGISIEITKQKDYEEKIEKNQIKRA